MIRAGVAVVKSTRTAVCEGIPAESREGRERISEGLIGVEGGIDMDDLLKRVPRPLRERFTEIVAITDRFCTDHLNEEYRQLCREMAVTLCREGMPVTRGKAVGWAAGIVAAVGWVNFIGDPSQNPHMRMEDIARAIGVSPATLAAKTKVIRDELNLMRFTPAWTLPSKLGDNPLVWLVQDQSGLIIDLRHAPRHVQEEAFRRGLIPFIPAAAPEGAMQEEEENP
jgi:hypothetical protein